MFKSVPKKYDQPREFEIAKRDQQILYPSNFIRTSKYNIINFLPFSLLGQFKRYANIYFLFIAILQSISIISPLNPISAIAPLVFVLGLSMIREGVEDYNRHVSDAEVNAMTCTRLVHNDKMKSTWADLSVGDLVYITENEMFAADILVLKSAQDSGVCYIETSSLDGEKNLKPKSAIKETQNARDWQDMLIYAQPPNPYLSEFDGRLTQGDIKRILNGKSLLLRGAFLRNTQWIIGVVVYTGEDTKIMRNSEPSRVKQSRIEVAMNKLILAILIVQVCACISSAVLSAWWLSQNRENHSYINQDYSNSELATISFFSYFLLYNTMIPISLVVSLEFVKVFQCYFINKDQDMYSIKRDKFAKAQTSTINEELGQVQYIFSDKTGTLTCNQMEFKYCIIGDILYGQNDNNKNIKIQNDNNSNNSNNNNNNPVQFQHSIFTFQDDTLSGIIEGKKEYITQSEFRRNVVLTSKDGKDKYTLSTQKMLIDQYFLLLASAHECLAQKEGSHYIYQGPSPDEITLVDAAMNLGYAFEGQSASQQTFTIQGKKKKVELLNSFEFDSARKRMSVLIKDEDGKYKLFIKGADNIIKQRLKKEQPFLPYIDEKLTEFSRIGLRTLLMAMRILSEAEYQQFEKDLRNLADIENKEEEKTRIANELESDLYLLGATAVEDKLQDEVPETIADFLKAKIKVWMLTGDKLETAENIAKSCRLIEGDFTVLRFSETDNKALRTKILDSKETYHMCIKEKKRKSIVIDGEALEIILQDNWLKKEFLKMGGGCDSVVCCRVTPKQKGKVVSMVKEGMGKVTLAIGDGANDVNMIQEADIGVGLYGNEGMRAVQSSDYALGEFRFLWKLILVHGHWSYIRIAEMILYFFYKNMIFTVPQYLFSFYSAYSAQTYFDDWYITFYNLFFTALPLIIRATTDRRVYYKLNVHNLHVRDLYHKSEEYIKGKFPSMYYVGQEQTIFTLPNFLFWWGQGLVHGMLVFFLVMACLNDESLTQEGHSSGFASLSITAYTAIIFIVDIKIALYTKFWTWVNFFVIFLLSVGIYVLYFFLSYYFPGTYSEYTPLYLIQSPIFYLLVAFLNAAIFIFDLIVNAVLYEFFKTEIDQIQNWRLEFKQLARQNDVLKRIEMIQLQKRECGVRQWGDSFYEAVLEEQLKSQRDQAQFDEQQAILDSNKMYATSPALHGPPKQNELVKCLQPLYVR